MEKQETVHVSAPKIVVQLLLVVVLIPLLPMIISGRWGWLEAWIYGAIHVVGFASSRYLASLTYLPNAPQAWKKKMQKSGIRCWHP